MRIRQFLDHDDGMKRSSHFVRETRMLRGPRFVALDPLAQQGDHYASPRSHQESPSEPIGDARSRLRLRRRHGPTNQAIRPP
jgi:hypothetical protein